MLVGIQTSPSNQMIFLFFQNVVTHCENTSNYVYGAVVSCSSLCLFICSCLLLLSLQCLLHRSYTFFAKFNPTTETFVDKVNIELAF